MSADAIAAAMARLQAGDAAGAERALAPALLVAGPQSAQPLMVLARIRQAQGRVAEAEQALRKAIAAAPKEPNVRQQLGNLLLVAGNPEAALREYQEAVRLAPGFDVARRNVARALVAARRFNEGEVAAREELAKERRADMLAVLATALDGQRRFEEALKAFDESLALAPLATTQHNRAMTLARMDRNAEAAAIYAELVQAGMASPDLFLNWSWAHMSAGDLDTGERLLIEGLRRFPFDRRLHSQLAEFRWSKRLEGETFTRDLEAALAAMPENTELRTLCAEFLTRAERRADAERLLREGATRAPQNTGMHAQLAGLLDLDGRLDEAEAVLRAALANNPGGGDLLYSLTHVLMRANRPHEARAALTQARAMQQDQLTLAYEATIARMMGDPEYERLYDYNRFVAAIDFSAPEGYASMDAFNAALGASLEALHLSKRHPIDRSLRGGTQTDRSLLESRDPVIVTFFKMIREGVRARLRALPRDPSHPFLSRNTGDITFADAWSVWLRPGGHHINHVHPEGWLSSAYYVRVPPLGGQANPHAGWIKFGEPQIAIPGCGPAHWVEPKPGRLAIFPSYMWHGTEPFHEGKERMTVAFDMAPA